MQKKKKFQSSFSPGKSLANNKPEHKSLYLELTLEVVR